MDVRCGRCATDYEFDDALISERGTTVKCTNCGYQFKVYPNPARATAPERWVVRDAAGQQRVFTTLRDLQRGIAEGRVGPLDVLSRGGEPPRTLSSIAELDHLFKMYRGPQKPVKQTLHGLAPEPITAVTRNAGVVEGGVAEGQVTQEEQSQVRQTPAPTEAVTHRPPAGEEDEEEANPFSETLVAEREPSRPPPSHQPESSESSQVRAAQQHPSEQELERAAGRVMSDELPPPLYAVEDLPTVPGYPLEEALKNERRARQSQPEAAAQPPPPPPPLGRPEPAMGSAPHHEAPAPSQPSHPAAAPQPRSAVVSPSRDSAPGASAQRTQPGSWPREHAAVPPPAPQSPAPQRLSPDAESSFEEELEPPRPRLAEIAGMYEDLEDPYHDAGAGKRAAIRWIVSLVLLGAAVLFALTTGREYLDRLKRPAAGGQRGDDRVAELVRVGISRLEQGELEAAQQELTRAQALSEADESLLAAQARLEVTFADQLWLKLRLLDPETQRAAHEATERELKTRSQRAQRAVTRAVGAASDREDVLRSRINLLRINGQIGSARSLIGRISGSTSKPENAYVLGALDLAEQAPVWSSVIDRLTTASATERRLGRSRALLIYALIRAQKPEQARAELDKLTSLNPKHPLLSELGDFVTRHAAIDGGVDAGPDAAEAGPVSGEEESAALDDARAVAQDFRRRLEAAGLALERGDLSRAEMLYRAVLKEQPGNVEALSGVADVARARQDHGTASQMYDQVLDQNPSYLPALMASADQKWSSGDRKGAVALYRQVLDQAGANSEYGVRALARIEQASREGAESEQPPSESSRSKPGGGKASGEPTESKPPSDSAPSRPGVDTTDLPEYF